MMKGKMTSGFPLRLILVFSLPILLSGLLQQCYNIADTMIVGRFLKLEALTGMGATWALNYIIIAFCQGAGMELESLSLSSMVPEGTRNSGAFFIMACIGDGAGGVHDRFQRGILPFYAGFDKDSTICVKLCL